MQAQDPLGKVTTADVSLFLKHNDPERKETQTSQAKQSRSGPSSGLDAVLRAGPPPWAPRGRTLSHCTQVVGGGGGLPDASPGHASPPRLPESPGSRRRSVRLDVL